MKVVLPPTVEHQLAGAMIIAPSCVVKFDPGKVRDLFWGEPSREMFQKGIRLRLMGEFESGVVDLTYNIQGVTNLKIAITEPFSLRKESFANWSFNELYADFYLRGDPEKFLVDQAFHRVLKEIDFAVNGLLINSLVDEHSTSVDSGRTDISIEQQCAFINELLERLQLIDL